MNTGQMLLALGAMILLSTTVLRVNNTFFTTDTVLDETKFNFLATSLGSSIIQEAKSKSFDKATDSASVSDVKFLTSAGDLGPDGGEKGKKKSVFNDFDDFNGYQDIDSTMPSAPFWYSCKVVYVDENQPDAPSSSKTWNKMITVTITSPYMSDVVKISAVYSYWFFR
jgi:hypothetical protein